MQSSPSRACFNCKQKHESMLVPSPKNPEQALCLVCCCQIVTKNKKSKSDLPVEFDFERYSSAPSADLRSFRERVKPKGGVRPEGVLAEGIDAVDQAAHTLSFYSSKIGARTTAVCNKHGYRNRRKQPVLYYCESCETEACIRCIESLIHNEEEL